MRRRAQTFGTQQHIATRRIGQASNDGWGGRWGGVDRTDNVVDETKSRPCAPWLRSPTSGCLGAGRCDGRNKKQALRRGRPCAVGTPDRGCRPRPFPRMTQMGRRFAAVAGPCRAVAPLCGRRVGHCGGWDAKASRVPWAPPNAAPTGGVSSPSDVPVWLAAIGERCDGFGRLMRPSTNNAVDWAPIRPPRRTLW